MSRRLETDYIQPQQAVPLFTEGRLKGSNIKGLQHFKMIQRTWPTQNIELVDIEVCHAFPVINHVVCYGRPRCVYKLASFKLEIQNTSRQILLDTQVQLVRCPTYVVTATTTYIFIYDRIDMVGRRDIFTHWKQMQCESKISRTVAEK